MQKLAYFLQHAGDDLQFDYVAHKFGPYAEALNHVMLRMEGHFIEGYGDRDQRSEITLLEGALERAKKEVEDDEDALARLDSVCRLIDGFETPYGMELLATTLFLAEQDATVRRSPQRAVERAHAWDARKRKLFQPGHVETAWQRLSEEGWMTGVPSKPTPAASA